MDNWIRIMERMIGKVTCICALFAFLAGGCGNSAQQELPDDVPIVATTEDVFSIGDVKGEEWESFTAVTDAVFDAKGNLVVVDNLQRRIVVVAQDGNRSHDLSRAGDGPGELRSPASVMAMDDGRLAVYDVGHRSFLVFGLDGAFLEQHRVDRGPASTRQLPGLTGIQVPSLTDLSGKTFRPLPDGRIVAFGGFRFGAAGRPVEVLSLGDGRDTLMMAWDLPSATDRKMEEVPTSGDNTRMFSFGTDRPHFAPPLLVDVLSDGRVAVVDSIGYRIKLLSSGGLVENVLERAILPRKVTPDVEQAVRDAMEAELTAGDAEESVTITAYGSGIDKETIDTALRHTLETNLRQLTFAAQIPVIDAMGVDSEDRIWVSRTGNSGASDGPTDVFSADGQYMGTLAPDQIRIPTAFGPDGLMAYVETDGLGVPFVHVVRLLRLAMPSADALD